MNGYNIEPVLYDFYGILEREYTKKYCMDLYDLANTKQDNNFYLLSAR